MKRKIYLLINVVVFIVTIYLANLMARETSTPIGATIGFTLLLLLVEVAISLISTIIGAISNLIDLNKISSPFITIYEQKLFALIKISKVDYYGDIESLRNRIKREIESIYEDKLRDKNISDKFKNWDGYIDKKSERDDKLEKLGIK